MVTGPPPRSGSFQYSEGTALRVMGFGPDVRNIDLQPEFGEFGHVLRINVLQGKGVAFVEFRDKEDAADAMAAMDGKKVLGCTLSVSAAGPPPAPRTRTKDQANPGFRAVWEGNGRRDQSAAAGQVGQRSRSRGDPAVRRGDDRGEQRGHQEQRDSSRRKASRSRRRQRSDSRVRGRRRSRHRRRQTSRSDSRDPRRGRRN